MKKGDLIKKAIKLNEEGNFGYKITAKTTIQDLERWCEKMEERLAIKAEGMSAEEKAAEAEEKKAKATPKGKKKVAPVLDDDITPEPEQGAGDAEAIKPKTDDKKKSRLERAKAAKENPKKKPGRKADTESLNDTKGLPSHAEAVVMAMATGGTPPEIHRMACENFAFGGLFANYNKTKWVNTYNTEGLRRKTDREIIAFQVDVIFELIHQQLDGKFQFESIEQTKEGMTLPIAEWVEPEEKPEG